MKLNLKCFAAFALIGIIGCSKSGADLNKSLKPVDPGTGKPQAVKDYEKNDSARALK